MGTSKFMNFFGIRVWICSILIWKWQEKGKKTKDNNGELLPKEELGTGKCLSKLQTELAIGASFAPIPSSTPCF